MAADQFGHVARQRYARFEALGDEEAAYQALEASLRNIRLLFDAYTLGEPQNDRIWPPDTVATVMAMGETPHERNQLYPRHFLSYGGFTDLAAWIREKADDRLTVWLYSFARQPESGVVRTWRTPFGQYEVTMRPLLPARGSGERGKGGAMSTTLSLHVGATVPVTLEPGRIYELTLALVRPEEGDFFARPDLALSPGQVSREGDSIRCVLHNLGNVPAANVQLRLVTEAGKAIGSAIVPHLDAPVDLVPRTAEVRFTNVPAEGKLRIVVDPEDAVAEIDEANNQVWVGP